MRDIQFLTATNDIMENEGKHYVTVFVACTVVGDDAQPEVSAIFSCSKRECVHIPSANHSFQVLEPHKCEQWKWVTWEEVSSYHSDPNSNHRLFIPLVNLLEQRPGFHPVRRG